MRDLLHQEPLAEQWDASQLTHLSKLPRVKRVVWLGTLVAVELKAEGKVRALATRCTVHSKQRMVEMLRMSI